MSGDGVLRCAVTRLRCHTAPRPRGSSPLPQPWRPRTLSRVWSRPPAERCASGTARRLGLLLAPSTSSQARQGPPRSLQPEHAFPLSPRTHCLTDPGASPRHPRQDRRAAFGFRVQIPVWTPVSPPLGKPQGARLLGHVFDSARDGSRAVCGAVPCRSPRPWQGSAASPPRAAGTRRAQNRDAVASLRNL